MNNELPKKAATLGGKRVMPFSKNASAICWCGLKGDLGLGIRLNRLARIWPYPVVKGHR